MNKLKGDSIITTLTIILTATTTLGTDITTTTSNTSSTIAHVTTPSNTSSTTAHATRPSNTSSTTAHVEHLDLPVTTDPFNTRHFIEHLSWQPTSLRDVIEQETVNQLQPWRWAGVGERQYETVTSFARVHCCREGKDDLTTDEPADHGAPCALPLPPPYTEGEEGLTSLWGVLSDQLAMEGCVAMVQMAHTIGRAVRTPEFLKDFDLGAVDWRQSGLVYLLPSVAASTSPPSSSAGHNQHTPALSSASSADHNQQTPAPSSASSADHNQQTPAPSSALSADHNQQTPALFLCLVEGSGNVSVTSQQGTIASGAASPTQYEGEYGAASPTQYEGEYGAGDCVYSPAGWWVSLEAATPTTALLLTWPDDIIITEEFMEQQERNEASESATKQELKPSGPEHLPADGRANEKNGTFLASFLPEEDEEKEYLKKLWLKPPVMPHFLQYYYFSKHAPLTQQQFISKIKADSLLVPNLVDCLLHSECYYQIVALFRALDLNEDGELSPRDVAWLTPRGLPKLQLHVDDLVQEIRDLALDQWYEAMEASPSEWEAFAERASDSKKESARAVAKRIQDGELTPDQLRIIKESLPDLYDKLEEINSLDDEEVNIRDEL